MAAFGKAQKTILSLILMQAFALVILLAHPASLQGFFLPE
jgi:hypothetical protein